jgi:sec-independent protein translocase protein TatB
MFDISFGELALIGLVALVVLGPERLPKVARMAGHLLGRLQRYVTDVKADINREIQLEDLKKLQQQMEHSAQEMGSSLSSGMRELEASLAETAQSVTAEIKAVGAEAAAPVAEPPALEAGLVPALLREAEIPPTQESLQREPAIEPPPKTSA